MISICVEETLYCSFALICLFKVLESWDLRTRMLGTSPLKDKREVLHFYSTVHVPYVVCLQYYPSRWCELQSSFPRNNGGEKISMYGPMEKR